MDRIKRLSNELMNEYSERFGTDFSTNKQALNEISIIRSKGLKNEIACYITKILQRQSKFEQRKQLIIENEKKTQERKKSRAKKTETTQVEEPATQVEEPATQVEEPATQVEEPATQVEESGTEKSVAEEILDDSKQ